MIRGIGNPYQGQVWSVSGANIQTLINLVQGFTVRGPTTEDVSRFPVLVFHVGTNNVGQTNTGKENLFVELLQAVRARCVNPIVYMSCILPRPKDHWRSGPQVRAVNRWLRRWARAEGIQTIDAPPLFLEDSGRVNELLYKDDRLHLNKGGLNKLRDKFRQVLSSAGLTRY